MASSVVATVLRGQPRAVSVFLAHRMACVGCALAEFDTLADAARAYGLALPDLLAELAGPATSGPTSRPAAAPPPAPLADPTLPTTEKLLGDPP